MSDITTAAARAPAPGDGTLPVLLHVPCWGCRPVAYPTAQAGRVVLSLLPPRVCQAPDEAQGMVPMLVPMQLGQSPQAQEGHQYREGPCPCLGVPSHRTVMLHLFGKPGFINTLRSCLHSITP